MDLDLIKLSLRAFQFLCAIIALSTSIAGYHFKGFKQTRFNSNATFYFLGINGGMIAVAVLIMALLEFKKVITNGLVFIAFDSVWFLFCLSGGIAGAASKAIVDFCDVYDTSALEQRLNFSCAAMKAGVAFTFITGFAFLATLLISVKVQFFSNNMNTAAATTTFDYENSSTPQGELGPNVGNKGIQAV